MTPRIEVLLLHGFEAALAVATGAMAWWRKETPEEDEMVSQATDVVLGALSDADAVGKIDAATDRNLRDQVTVEQAMAMERERELRGFGWRRN